MARAFNPSPAPAAPLAETLTPKINSIAFGDGYAEDTPSGLNPNRRTVRLSWPALTVAEADVIYDFLALELGWGRLRFTPPQETEAGLWKCTALNRGRASSKVNTLSATFEETVL